MFEIQQPLSLLFTKTARFRLEPAPREQLRDPSDLTAWLAAAGLSAPGSRVSDELLREARELREAIYRSARAVAEAATVPPDDRDLLNAWADRHDAVRVLGDHGAGWRFPPAHAARSALAIVAVDAVDTVGGARDGTIKVCEGEGCVAVFLDNSRGRSRRWCSMATCGNRAKKAAMRNRAE
ncbi:CGNR zinc finger domain-containing protein [Actinoplanes sp. NPDC049265]|uniref:CGNR zinc finger domain-containing protein n=1 Tax=Actinoplanes sp. NPDC049265 TaxID=3363902 RepID=UPI003717CA50